MSNRDYWDCDYSVKGFMSQGLKLKGTELSVYAIIYGFSQSEKSGGFWGSADYIVGLTNIHQDTIYRALGSLLDKKLIKRKEMIISGVGKRYVYNVIREAIEAAYSNREYDKKSEAIRQKVVTPYDKKSEAIRQKVVTPYDKKSDNLKTLNLNLNSKEEREVESAEAVPAPPLDIGLQPEEKDYTIEIIKACADLMGSGISSLMHTEAFRSHDNQKTLKINITTSQYNINECINTALKQTKNKIKLGKSNAPLLDFRTFLYTALKNGGNGITRQLTPTEQAIVDEKAKEQAAIDNTKLAKYQQDIGYKNVDAETIEKYKLDTAMLFDVDVDELEDLQNNYVGGSQAFFRERQARWFAYQEQQGVAI